MQVIISILLLSLAIFSIASDKQFIGDVAMMNYDEVESRALEYIDVEFPEIILEEVKVYQIAIFHDPKRTEPELQVMFTHKKAFREGPNERFSSVYSDGQSVEDYNQQEYYTIYFNGEGLPSRHRVDSAVFMGTYEDFLEEFEKI